MYMNATIISKVYLDEIEMDKNDWNVWLFRMFPYYTNLMMDCVMFMSSESVYIMFLCHSPPPPLSPTERPIYISFFAAKKPNLY